MDGVVKPVKNVRTDARRACVYRIGGDCPEALGYVRQTLAAMRSAGLQVIVVTDAARKPRIPGAVFVPSLRAAFEHPAVVQAWETLFMDDRWMGPVKDLAPMLKAADEWTGDAWQLARSAPFWGLRQKAVTHPAFAAWLRRQDRSLASALTRAKLQTGVLYDSETLRTLTDTPMLDEPRYMTETLGCPFFMHELFHRDYDDVVMHTLGHMASEYYRYLTRTPRWNVNPMWDYLLADCHMEDLYRNLHLTYVSATEISDRKAVRKHLETHGLALMMHLYYEDLIPQSLEYTSHFPPETHVYVTTDSSRKSAKIKRAFARLNVAKVTVRVIPNRGRDVSALLVGMKDYVGSYDYICTYHDKKVLQTSPGSIGAGFGVKIRENLIASEDFVCNTVQTFIDNPRLGILSPPPPHHADYFFTLGTCWGANYAVAAELREQLNLHVPMAENKRPIAPLGTCFWFRKGALDALYDAGWTYDSFPAEPISQDGTMLHAIERLYPFAAQAAGLYSAYLLSDRYAPVEYASLYHYVRGFHRVFFQNDILSYHRYMREIAARRLRAQPETARRPLALARRAAGKLKRVLRGKEPN